MTNQPELALNSWAVLTLLVDDGPAHGFAISTLLARGTAIGQAWSVSRPLVYRALDQLEASGLVHADPVGPGDGGPNRRPFRATASGRRAAGAWRCTPVTHLRDVRAELMLKLVLAERSGLDSAELLRNQLAAFARQPGDLATGAVPPEGTPGHVLAVWRYELSTAIERTLTALLSESS